jgi:WD40 repeat protein
VATGAKDRVVRIFDLETGELEATLRGHDGYIEGLAFSPDGSTLASTSEDTTVRLWRTADWACAGVLRGHLATVRGAIWSRDGASLATVGLDDSLRVWDGGRVASGWSDGVARVHDSETGELLAAFPDHGGSVQTVAFTQDGHGVVTGDARGTVRMFPAEGGPARFACDLGDRAIHHVAVSADRIAAARNKG